MISIIVPVYNVEPYLCQSIESILSQTYKNLEIILIDDGSFDRCGEICDIYAGKDNRIRVIHTTNKGLSAARNLGIREAKGEFIGFVDSDDWIESDMYEDLLNYIEDYSADISACGFWYEFGDYQTIYHLSENKYDGITSLYALIEGRINNSVWNKLFKKDIFKNVLFPEGKCFEDIAIMHLAFNHAKRVVCNSASKYHYR